MSELRFREMSSSQAPVTCQLNRYVPDANCYDWYRVVPANPFIVESAEYTPYEQVKTMEDVVTPGWRRMVNEGRIINNPMTSTQIATWRHHFDAWYESRLLKYDRWCDFPSYSGYVPNLYGGARWVGTRAPGNLLGPLPSAPEVSSESLMDLANTQAYAKANESEAQGLVMLAEGKGTIQSLTSILSRLIKLGRALRKWDVKYLTKGFSAKNLSDSWMEGRYFIRPLIYDMKSCVSALNKAKMLKPMRKTYRSGASATETDDEPGVILSTFASGGTTYYHFMGNRKASTVVSVRSGVLAAIEAITESMIWGLDQPFEAMWELVPFSFVVDWFFNVGKTIASWTPRYGIKVLASWVVVDTTSTQGTFFTGFQNVWTEPSAWENTISASGAYVVKMTHTRQRVPNLPRSILPTFSVRLDAAKLLDLAIWGKRYFK